MTRDGVLNWVAGLFANVVRGREDLHSYQADKAIPFLRDNPFSGLFCDMGLGKSISSLTVIADLIMELDLDCNDKVLVIGPPRVATNTWPTEITLWQHTAWLDHTVLYVDDDDPRVLAAGKTAFTDARYWGHSTQEAESARGKAQTTEKERLRKLLATDKSTVHIVPSNWVEWLAEFHQHNWPYRTVFIDESSQFKDHTTGRFKALRKMRNTEGAITRLHILTATPAAESYIHLFTQIFLLDKGERFGTFITKYRDKYFTQNKWTRKYKLREGAEQEILAKIADICLVMKAEDYLDVAKPTIRQRYVRMNEREQALYDTLQTDFVVTLDNGAEIEAETAANLGAKLLQMASGALYETVETLNEVTGDIKRSKRTHAIHDHKIQELQQIVDEAQGATFIVAYHFQSSLERLKKAFPKAVVMDREGKCVKPWNAGKIPMLLMHPQSGGHGLNLQAGGHNIVFFDLPWSLELYLQLIGRLARQGQKHPVLVQILTTRGTVDEGIFQALQNKEDAQEVFFGLLKRLIRKHRQSRKAKVIEAAGDDL